MSDTNKIVAAILTAAKQKGGTAEVYVDEYLKMLTALETAEKAKTSAFPDDLEKVIRNRHE